MIKADITLITTIIKTNKSLTITQLAEISLITKRRLYDVLPLLEATEFITRPARGIIEYIEPVKDNNYDTETILVGSNGVITSVERLSPQQIKIESTSPGYNVVIA